MVTAQEQANKALMANVMRAYAQGDLQPLFAALDDKVTWKAGPSPQHFRFGGVHQNREGVIELQAMVAANYIIHRVDPIEIVAEGDTVWGLFNVEMTHQKTGRLMKYESAFRWVVCNGKVVLHQSFYDTASLLKQQGEDPAAKIA